MQPISTATASISTTSSLSRSGTTFPSALLPTPVTAIVQEDGLSSAVNEPPLAPAILGNDLSDGNRSGGETTSSDEASGAAGSLRPCLSAGPTNR